ARSAVTMEAHTDRWQRSVWVKQATSLEARSADTVATAFDGNPPCVGAPRLVLYACENPHRTLRIRWGLPLCRRSAPDCKRSMHVQVQGQLTLAPEFAAAANFRDQLCPNSVYVRR